MFEKNIAKTFGALALLIMMAGCGEPRAVMLPLQYPNGTAVKTVNGEPVMAGFQTYGSAMHPNATALYEQAKPATCADCAHLGAVVSEPSVFRQTTGIIGATAVGTGSIMTGIGVLDYGHAAEDGKLGTTVTQNTNVQESEPSHHHDRRDRYDDSWDWWR